VSGVRFAYADPPYLGQGAKLYGAHHADAADYDDIGAHRKLVDRLCEEWPDGWAMSTSSPSLRHILPLCPEDVRVCAWVKPFAIFKPNVGLAYAWEPVIFRGGRRIERTQPTVRDWLAESITLRRGLTGAKPERFAFWLFSMFNACRGDAMDDIFPGTGAVTEAWQKWQALGGTGDPPTLFEVTGE